MTEGPEQAFESEDLEVEAAWMYYVEGLTQSEIAQRRGLSKVKVHRLLQTALSKGLVQVHINAVPHNCITLETKLMEIFGLSSCSVVPVGAPEQDMYTNLKTVGCAGARFLHARLEPTEPRVIGIGSGRTIAELVRNLPLIRRPNTTFVSITGDFAALSDANPFEVINGLIRSTGGIGYAFTAPLILDQPDDRDVLMRQAGVRKPLSMAEKAEFLLVGLGHVGTNSFFDSYGLISDAERAELVENDVVADLVGHLLAEDGTPVDCRVARRLVSVDLDLLKRKPIHCVCGGWEKRAAVLAALKSGLLNGLITTSDIAEACIEAVGGNLPPKTE